MKETKKQLIQRLTVEKEAYKFFKYPMLTFQIAGMTTYITVVTYFILSKYSLADIVLYSGLNLIWLILVVGGFQFGHAQFKTEIKQLEKLEGKQ